MAKSTNKNTKKINVNSEKGLPDRFSSDTRGIKFIDSKKKGK